MTNYRDAVKALASSITSRDRGLSDEEKIDLARGIISRGSPPRDDIEIDISDEKDFQILRDHLGELQRARDAELGKNIQASVDNAKRLNKLRDELKQDISRAYDEDIELESIASKLQDEGLGEIAGREEEQINDLGARLEELAVKSKEVDRLEQALESMMDEHRLETDELSSELKKRAGKVSRLVRSHGEASDEGGSEDSSGKPPDPSGDPWIVSISDIHGYYSEAVKALTTLQDKGFRPVVKVDSNGELQWARNNYILVFNGDVFDRGNANTESFEMVLRMIRDGNARYLIGNHELAALMPDVYTLAKSNFYSELNSREGPGLLERVADGLMEPAVKFYDHTYVHAGMNSKYDLSVLNSTLSGVARELAEAWNRSEGDYISKQRELSDKFTVQNDDSFNIDSLDNDLRKVFGFDLRDGGRGPASGIAWLDWKYFDGSGPPQVVGHTRKKFPVRKHGSVNANTIRKNLDNNSDDLRGPSITVEKPSGELFVLTRKGNGEAVRTDKADLPSES